MIALAWEKYEHHKALIDNPVEYPIIMAKLKPAIGRGKFLMSHVQFNDDATAALTAPVTEIVGITLKDGHAKQELDDVLCTLKTMAALETGSFPRAVWGPTIEDASKFWLIIGWQSVEVRNSDKSKLYIPKRSLLQAHYDVVSQEESGEIVKALGRIANHTLGHVSFWDYTEIIRAAPEAPLASL